MKKLFSVILSAVLLAGMTISAMAWEKDVDYVVIEEIDPDNMGDAYGDMYPGSLDWDWAECTSGTLLKGTIIAGYNGTSHCWSNGTDNAAKAFDGDTSTFFDPYEATTNSWCGMILDQPYELTEIRLMPRESFPGRMAGAAIQGSNNGTDWVDIVYITGITEAPAGYDYHCFTPETNADYVAYYSDYGIEQPDFSTYWVGSGSYQYYRYINLEGVHGDLADIELYGNPAPATEVTAEMVNTTVIYVSDLENFYEDVENTGTAAVVSDGAIEGTVIGGGGAYSETAGYACAFDGDPETFYDPASAGPKCFTGIQTAEPYALTEVRVMPRLSNFPRTAGATIQGSNDGGATWTTLVAYTADDCLAEDAEQTWISKTITDTNGYTMFRYVSDGTSHGDVAEVAFFGAPASAAAAPAAEEPAVEEAPAAEAPAAEETVEAPAAEEPAAEETVEAPAAEAPAAKAPETFDAGLIAALAAIVSAAGYAVSKKRR
ncbi:MAG: discoidin domain-containing protein [Eubacteriales bacterium]